jgi:hypothetical protein
VEEDGEWGSVGGEDDDLGDTSVEGFGALVGALWRYEKLVKKP